VCRRIADVTGPGKQLNGRQMTTLSDFAEDRELRRKLVVASTTESSWIMKTPPFLTYCGLTRTTWPDLTWPDIWRSDPIWSHSTWLHLIRRDLTRAHLTSSHLTWSHFTWPRLSLPYLSSPDLTWPDLPRCRRCKSVISIKRTKFKSRQHRGFGLWRGFVSVGCGD